MSSIITQGYGPNQRIILEGYGPSLFWLTVHLYQTLLFSPSFSRRWDALRTFPESVHHTDSIIKRTDFRLLESIILSPAVSALKFVERVVELISRKIPWMRVPFKVKIPIKGTTVRPFRREIPMYGDLFYPRQLGVDLKGTTTFPFHRTISLY